MCKVRNISNDLDAADVFEGFLPFALMETSCCKYDKVSTILWCKLNTLLIILLNLLSEIPADYFLSNFNLIFSDVWDLKEHGCYHENTVKNLKIQMQMWWNKSLLFLLLFLSCLLLLLSLTVSLC